MFRNIKSLEESEITVVVDASACLHASLIFDTENSEELYLQNVK
jgi:hypothetical protein